MVQRVVLGEDRKAQAVFKAHWDIVTDPVAFGALTVAQQTDILRKALLYLARFLDLTTQAET